MARKRKAEIQQQKPSGPTELDPRDSRKRIRTYEDVANSDDEFHLNQDKINLGEDPDVKRRRQWAEQEEFLQASDEEILGFTDDEDEEDDESGDQVHNEDSLKARSSRSGLNRRDRDHESDEEDEYEQELGWGTSKSDLYGADAIETEEQALEEEAEALRLQRKQLALMNVADYGFDESEWQDGRPAGAPSNEGQGKGVVTEVLPQLHISPDMGASDRLKVLRSRYPEFDPLSKELLQLQEILPGLKDNLSAIGLTKFRVASAYLGAIIAYFSLLTSTASRSESHAVAMPANQLRDHAVMDSLIKCRDIWLSVEKIPDGGLKMTVAHEKSDDVARLAVENSLVERVRTNRDQPKKSRAERYAEAQQEAANMRRAERLQRTEASLADLDSLVSASVKKKHNGRNHIAVQSNGHDSDLGEEVPLTEREAADKAKRRKSLRFYTSQIAQKANKRGTAGKNTGGDDDVPYRERLKDRQARLNAEAEKRGQRKSDPGVELGGDSDEDDDRHAKQIREDVDDDDYYDLIAAKTDKRKRERAAFADAQKRAELEGGRVVQEEIVDPDGKRRITYAIEKNKGLTPHRKKDNRNPRVKKRKKFNEKKKKLASMKPTYKGGEGRGGYRGELTGIKSGLIKSTKL